MGSGKLSVQGFRAGGKRGKKYGLAIILSEGETTCSVMATSNRIRAAPVELSIERAKNKSAGAIVISSGNANAFTGAKGLEDAKEMAENVASSFDIKENDVIVNSTGIIGQRLDMESIRGLIREVVSEVRDDDKGIEDAANAMMTTDAFEKISSKTVDVIGGSVQITGIAKGAGMIAPDMQHATMIAIVITDAQIPKVRIDEMLKEAVDRSFNMIIVDGDVSTNDMVVLMANGRADNNLPESEFQDALNQVCMDLAKLIVKDGEGATKLFEVEVVGAASREDARKAAKSVVSSTLVKTAVFGENPNWGRVIAALGYSGAELNRERLSLTLRKEEVSVVLVSGGKAVALKGTPELKKAGEILKENEFTFTADMGAGEFSAVAMGCDLGYNYVKTNAEYST